MKKILLALSVVMMCGFTANALTGDVNGDNEVSIADLNILVNLILNNSYDAAGDINGDGELGIADVNLLVSIILAGPAEDDSIIPKEITLNDSALVEDAEIVPDDEDALDYGDYVENTTWATTVRINFDGETATVTGNPSSVVVSINGAHVSITSAAKRVRYIVSGTTTNGSLKFYSEKKFQLQLNGVDITNPNGAAINNQCGKSFYLVLNEGTVNTLRDGEAYTMVEAEDQKAALFSEGQILISGKGKLNIYSVGKHCMASDDFVFVRPGCQLYLNSTSGHGIKAKDYVHIKGGVINMEIAAAGAKGINCDSLVYVTGGRTTIINTGATKADVDSLGNTVWTSCAGVKADYNMTMTGGTLNVKCTGDDAKGLNVAQPLLFSGGELNVVVTGGQTIVAPKGVKCDTDVTIQGGSFYSCTPKGKALDVDGTVSIADGYTSINNTDSRLVEIIY